MKQIYRVVRKNWILTVMISLLALFLACILMGMSTVLAQDYLPRKEQPLDAVVAPTLKDSRQGSPRKGIKAPKGAPNVLLIMLDDVGYGNPSTFGGPIPQPTLDKLAETGIRYNRFHNCAVCSPTRAALLTGRNHHLVSFGIVTEMKVDYPGYECVWPLRTACVAETLRQNGYNTSAFGKWHNTPAHEVTPVGPYDRWPARMGFEYFYGFLAGESSQWEPRLIENTTLLEPNYKNGKTLNEDLADHAINWLHNQQGLYKDKPFFLYFAPGALHAPHHVPKEWADRFKGKFDGGWDKYRVEVFERQKKMGIIPADAKLTPRPASIPAWDSLPANEKKMYARMMEVYAGYMAQSDYEVGRVVKAVEDMGLRDDTLIIYVFGDNGASGEGALTGSFNELLFQNSIQTTPEQQLKAMEVYGGLDALGGPEMNNHYSCGWAWAGSAPFQWMKQVASHFGGMRTPLIISWPERIKDKGGMRTQFHHVIDIVPTILDVAGIKEASMINGIPQDPIEGVSMVYTFDSPKAEGRKKTQYFEMLGYRGIYHDGWFAGAFVPRPPWIIDREKMKKWDSSKDKWELYNLEKDFTQAEDVADKYPEKLKELQDIFMMEATKNKVLPIGAAYEPYILPKKEEKKDEGPKKYTLYPGMERIQELSAPNIRNTPHTIVADIEIPENGAEGVVLCIGDLMGGATLYVRDGKPVYEYSFSGLERYLVSSDEKLPAGRIKLKYEFTPEGDGWTRGGTGRIYVNDKKVAEGKIKNTVPLYFTDAESMDVGKDLGSPVSLYYKDKTPFAFTGKIYQVDIEVK